MNIDHNATAFLRNAIECKGVSTIFNQYEISELGGFYVPWDSEKICELSNGDRISVHEWKNKHRKFEKFKNIFLNNNSNTITIFTVRTSFESPILIIDGVHRSIGLYKAYMEYPLIQSKTNLIVCMFESPSIIEMEDYKKLINSLN